jgi:peroxiredoxin
MNKAGPIITVGVGLVLVVVIAWRFGAMMPPPGGIPATGAGFPAPAASGITLDGQRWNLADQRGKVVLLDFWATWCPPCVAALPEIQKLHERFKTRSDFVLIGVSLDYTKSDLTTFIQRNGLAWPQIFDSDGGNDLARKFGVSAIPAVFLIDRQGQARRVYPDAEDVGATIEKLLPS